MRAVSYFHLLVDEMVDAFDAGEIRVSEPLQGKLTDQFFTEPGEFGCRFNADERRFDLCGVDWPNGFYG